MNGFYSNDIPEAPAELNQRIMRRIVAIRRRRLVAKTVGFGGLFAASVSLIVAGGFNAVAQFSQSGFFNFASLFFSDFSVAAANFQDFAYSIIESFPVFSTAFLFAGIGFAIWSAAHFFDDVSQLRYS